MCIRRAEQEGSLRHSQQRSNAANVLPGRDCPASGDAIGILGGRRVPSAGMAPLRKSTSTFNEEATLAECTMIVERQKDCAAKAREKPLIITSFRVLLAEHFSRACAKRHARFDALSLTLYAMLLQPFFCDACPFVSAIGMLNIRTSAIRLTVQSDVLEAFDCLPYILRQSPSWMPNFRCPPQPPRLPTCEAGRI